MSIHTNSPHITRRTVLRGLGTLMALPALEAMMPPLTALARSGASKAAAKIPVRMAFCMVPNGIHMPAWTPSTTGAFDLTPTLTPLANVRRHVSILTGLTHHNADGLGDGPGDHARSAAVWLTGVHPRKTAGADIHLGKSVDQIAADTIGRQTQFASLELGCEPSGVNGECDSGYSCAYSSNIAWRTPTQPLAKEIDPRAVFQRLFGSADSSESAQARARQTRDRASILDFVAEDAHSLNTRLGVHDRAKLDEYMTSVRDIERRVNRVQHLTDTAGASALQPPTGIPDTYGEHLRLMADMLVLAFQTDQTRVCSFMWANEGSNRSFAEIGVPEGHHDLSHHGGMADKQAKLQQINQFQIAQLAYLLEKMQSIKEADGTTLLDNSLVVFGGGISDGNRHNHDDLPVLLAGGAAASLPQGKHLIYPDGTPMANLYVSLLSRAGVRTEGLGDATGRLQHLM